MSSTAKALEYIGGSEYVESIHGRLAQLIAKQADESYRVGLNDQSGGAFDEAVAAKVDKKLAGAWSVPDCRPLDDCASDFLVWSEAVIPVLMSADLGRLTTFAEVFTRRHRAPAAGFAALLTAISRQGK